MEQERKIEKWLRAYAKKRRGQAGESFNLDPAARRLLQNEVSRKAPSSEDEDDTMSLWEVLRQQWAFLLGFAVCIFVLASFVLHTLPIAKKKALLSVSSQSASAQTSVQNLRRIPGSILSDTNAQAPISDSAQIASKSARPSSDQSENRTFSANTVGQITNLNLAENASAPSPAPVEPMTPPNEMTPPAPGTPAAMPQSENAAVSTEGNFAVAQTPAMALRQTLDEVQQTSEKFGPAAAPRPAVQNNFLNTIPVPLPCSPVLRNFQVSQNGNTIRVVDQDGSVYTGMLQSEDLGGNAASSSAPAAAESGTQATKADSPKMAGTDKVAPSQQQITGQFDNNAPPAAQSYSFRVGGLNRTLNQRVVFTATLLEDLSLMKNAQVTFGMTANAAVGAAVAQQLVQSKLSNQMAQLPWSNLRIAGTAVINHTNQMRINALPFAPPAKTSNLPPN